MVSKLLAGPDLAPDIFRQRLLVEGYFSIEVDETVIREFLFAICDSLGLQTYSPPIIFSPESGMGREENAGYDAFVPLIDSGISAYFWSGPKFLSIVFYTCKGFDADAAVTFTRDYFTITGDISTHSF